MKAVNMKLPVRKYITFKLRVVIHFLTEKGKTAAEIHRELVQMYGEICINASNVRRKKQDSENYYRVLLENEQQTGWQADSLTVHNICCNCEMFAADDRFSLNKTVAQMISVGCGWSTIHTIIHNVLQL